MAGYIVRSVSYAGESEYGNEGYGPLQSTKRRTYSAMPTRYPLPSSASRIYDTHTEDYLLSDRVSNASYLSDYVLDDGYDTAMRSRNRDARLLRDATHAIHDTPRRHSSSSAALLSPRRFPRRFGKPSARKNKSSSFYGPRIAAEARSRSVTDLRASPAPVPSSDWRNYARARSVSVARSMIDDDVYPERTSLRFRRAQSVDPAIFRPLPPSRRILPPSLSLRSSFMTAPVHPGYDPLYVEYEPDTKPLPRRKPRLLVVPRRPVGNYYERVLRRRGKPLRRSYYDVAPLGRSRLAGTLSDVGGVDEYSGASLVLSVEGAGLSPEGKRVGFNYTPPPIPLFGRGLGVDERYLGSSSAVQPLDAFLTGYMSRMGALKERLNVMERDRVRRQLLNLESLNRERRAISVPLAPQLYVPTEALYWQRPERVPVTTFRKRRDDDHTQRLDVIPLGDIKPRFNSTKARALILPKYATGGLNLSVLDKINIKVSSESFATPQTSVAARRVARGRSLVPRATSAPPRPLFTEVDSWADVESYEAPPRYDTVATSAATSDYYYYPDLPRRARPIVVYARPAASVIPDRAKSVPPAVYYQQAEERQVAAVPVRSAWPLYSRAASLPPDVVPVRRRRHYPYYERSYYHPGLPYQAAVWDPLPSAGLRAHRVPRQWFLPREPIRTVLGSPVGYYEPVGWIRRRHEEDIRKAGIRRRVLASPLARASLARAWGRGFLPSDSFRTRLSLYRESPFGFPVMIYPRKGRKPSNRAKAAIIASKLEPDPIKRRRPRSEYAAKKYRTLNLDAKENVYTKVPQSSGLYASNPPLPKQSERKAIRTDDGYSKPKNVLSWQYRLESKMTPGDLLYQPSSFGRIREQVREAQDRMDRHRQMLDRYLPEEGVDSSDVAGKILRKMADMEKRDPMISGGGAEPRRSTVKVPHYYACGVDPSNPPVSDLRRRIRRTLNKTRRSSVF